MQLFRPGIVTAQEVNAAAIEAATLTAIELHLPDEHEADNVSVSLNPADVSWHTADKMPEHVGHRYVQAQAELARCRDVHDAEDALEQLNEKPLNISGRNVAPTQGLEGLLEELAEDFRHYIEEHSRLSSQVKTLETAQAVIFAEKQVAVFRGLQVG